MIYQPEIETMGRAEMEALQLKRLQETVAYVYERVPMYKERLDALRVKPEDIQSLDDIRLLPFTVKDDLRDHYPYDLFAVPMKEIVRIHASSGTTGRPTVVGYTRDDIEMWSTCVARLAAAGGATDEDIAQISFGYGLFTGALGLHQGLSKIGAAVIPISSGNTERQINLMADFGTTLLVATPSYALYMAEVAERMGMMDKIKLRTGLFGAEGSTEEMRRELERRWHITATENYGMSELVGPGVSGECTEKCGMHINEDYFYCEVVDPETGEPVPDGEIGELVLTTLDHEMMPLIRYRTRDLTRILPGKCPCGRTHLRIDRIKGRSDDMFIIKGVNIFPMQVEKVLVQFPELGSNYLITLETINNQDEMIVEVELSDLSTDNYIELEKIRKAISRQLKDEILVTPKVKLVKKGSLPQSEGKAVRVKDLRDNK